MTESLTQNQAVLDVTPSENTVPIETSAPQEKMISQDEVNYITSKVKAEAYEKGKRDQMLTNQSSMVQQGAGGDEERIVQKAVEKMQHAQAQQAEQANIRKTVNQFIEKMNAGSGEYSDFDETVKVLNLPAMASVVELATEMPNTASLMYEFAKNPEKLQIVQGLIRDDQIGAAKKALQKLSKSIDDNKKAAKEAPEVREPLNQLKPSANVADLEPNSLQSFKRATWARG